MFIWQVLAGVNFFRIPATGGPSEVLREGALVDAGALFVVGLVWATNSTPWPAVSGDFVVKSNRVFYSKFRDDFYARSLEGGDEILLWQDMTSGDWDGDVEEITASPFHNAVFFVFEASSAFLMMWDIETSAVKLVAYMTDVCFKGYSVTREHAYVSGCEGVYRVPLPSF